MVPSDLPAAAAIGSVATDAATSSEPGTMQERRETLSDICLIKSVIEASLTVGSLRSGLTQESSGCR